MSHCETAVMTVKEVYDSKRKQNIASARKLIKNEGIAKRPQFKETNKESYLKNIEHGSAILKR